MCNRLAFFPGLFLITPVFLAAQPQFIASLYPPQHGLNIPVDAELRVGLQEPLDPASLSDSSIYVWSDITGLHKLTVTLENDNKDLRIVPRHWRLTDRPAFNAGERVIVTITTRLRYVDGRQFEGFTWHYTVAVKQNHEGNFNPEATFGGILSTNFIVSDFNGDGWPDLIGNADIDYKMLVYFNDGTGIIRFDHKNDPISPGNETADIDRDGDQDIPYTGNSSILNDGAGNFYEKKFPFMLNGFAKAHDFNNDGIIDFVIGSVISDTLHFGISYDEKPFEKLQEIITPIHHPTFYYHGLSYDLTNDGRIDFIYVGGFGGGSELVGFASFQTANDDSLKLLQTYGLSYEQVSFYGNDLDEDRDIDYAFVPGGADNYVTFFNDSGGQLNPSGLQRDPLDTRLAETVEGGDFDGDGDIDLAFASTNRISVMPESFAPDVSIYFNDGNGNFLLDRRIPLPFNRPLSWVLRAVDLDLDSDLDLIGIANGLFYVLANGSYATTAIDEKLAHMPVQFLIKSIYPNPAQKQTTIELKFSESSKEEVTISIFDITGRLVRSWAFNEHASSIQLRWELRNQMSDLLPNGVYFVQARMGKFTAKQKLLVIK